MLHELTGRKKAELKVRTRLDYYLKKIKMLRKYGLETSRCFSKTIRVCRVLQFLEDQMYS